MPDDLQRLVDTVPSRPAGDLDDEQLLAKARDSTRWDLTVTMVRPIAPRMLRMTLSAQGLDAMHYRPGQDFTVLVARNRGRDIRRRYTIAGRDNGALYIDIYLHGQGVGSAWAMSRRPGDVVSAIGPRGTFMLGPAADWHIFLGDETSLPGICAMLDATNRPAQVVVEVDAPRDWNELSAGARPATQWTWLPRASSWDVGDVLALPAGDGHAYLSGEATRVLAWRSEVERLGLDSAAVSQKAYWGLGRANATHGEPL
jgi:NADPH-dependent ferric siderophore reductase